MNATRDSLAWPHALLLAVFCCEWAAPEAAAAPFQFAVIGDYGAFEVNGSPKVGGVTAEERVANMVKRWDPDIILTTGDNNYSFGEAATIDGNVGRFYHSFIGNYQGAFGAGAGEGPRQNRFFPTLGNHDWGLSRGNADAYLDYFDLPGAGFENSSGNERYYDFTIGDMRFLAYDSDRHEPDGVVEGSIQSEWLRTQLETSEQKWNFVYFHHSPFSSSSVHGDDPRLQLPFKAWGADAVFTGHDHLFERLIVDDFPYFISAAAGRTLYRHDAAVCGSRFRHDASFGALLVTVEENVAEFEFRSINDGAFGENGGAVVDRYTIDLAQPNREPLAGDTNDDDQVDLNDLNNVRNSFGGVGGGDTNHDCLVDLVDLNNVRNQFGAVRPPAGPQAHVPEPAAVFLLCLGLLVLGASFGRRQDRSQY